MTTTASIAASAMPSGPSASRRRPADVNAVMGLPQAARRSRSSIEKHGRTPIWDPLDEIHRDFVGRSIAFYAGDPSVREVPGAGGVFDLLRSRGSASR